MVPLHSLSVVNCICRPTPFDREEEQKTWPAGLSPCSSPQSLTSQASQERQVGCRGLGSLGVSLCGGRAMAGALGGMCHIIGRTRKFLQRNLGPVRPQPVPPGGFASCLGFAAASWPLARSLWAHSILFLHGDLPRSLAVWQSLPPGVRVSKPQPWPEPWCHLHLYGPKAKNGCYKFKSLDKNQKKNDSLHIKMMENSKLYVHTQSVIGIQPCALFNTVFVALSTL